MKYITSNLYLVINLTLFHLECLLNIRLVAKKGIYTFLYKSTHLQISSQITNILKAYPISMHARKSTFFSLQITKQFSIVVQAYVQ